jgi:hypothetical protein
MKVLLLNECGFEESLYGFALSYKKPNQTGAWFTQEKFERTKITAQANAHRDGGHNKLLEHIIVWLSVTATFEWWKQFDTYRIGMSKQSSSTMHTLDSVPITSAHFDIRAEEFDTRGDHQLYVDYLKMLNRQQSRLKSKALPQGYMQEREVVTSYKVIRHIIKQRYNHKLPEWISFIEQVVDQIEYPAYLGNDILDILGR